MMVLLNRTDYWQAAYLIPKGGADALRAQPIDEWRGTIAKLAPFIAERTDTPASWNDVKTLEVRLDRLERWYRPGLLLIGDAAHAMSPIGGVGINLAIQDAIVTANTLVPLLREQRPITERSLRAVQDRRLPPTRLILAAQLQIQKRVISRAGAIRASAGNARDFALAAAVPHGTPSPRPAVRLWSASRARVHGRLPFTGVKQPSRA
ncbi:hypothetical protein NB231_15533 [Nitrococcus mobilis Nb-231]|uniref:FAD-binding domain-containing protein n=2 Tax=Nitrococcus mobilis TaxID=35797 RepID=A4BLQ7_9GAMM|nr:hypothetical protein NB231_15533 [Nitrococcus mobilis Nb-231]